MSETIPQRDGVPVRASDAEREHTVALLQHGFTEGRLTQAELEERVAAAFAAQTRAQLRDLTADLPARKQPRRSGRVLDQRLLLILLCVHPPAALAYWLYWRLSSRRQPAAVGAGQATSASAGPGPQSVRLRARPGVYIGC